jgi:MFS family permease
MYGIKAFFKLPRTIYILFAARIINSIGSFVYPLLTILLTAKLGFSNEVSGRIITVAISCGGIGMLLGGRLADQIGRKKILILSSLLGATAFIICAFMGTSRNIVYLIIAGNFFSIAQWPTVNAMVTDTTTKETRQSAFSLLYLGTNIGVAVGPLMAGFLINSHLKLFFLLDAITTIVSLIPVIIFVKDTLPSKKAIESIGKNDTERAEKGSVFRALLKRPILLIFTFVSVIYSLIYAQYTFGLPLFVNDIFGNTNGPKFYGSLMSVNAIQVILLTLFIIGFTKRIKPIINISIAGFLFAFGFGMLYFSKYLYLFVISTLIWTLGEIILTVNSSVFIANNSPITHRGRFNAVISFVQQSGFALAPLLTGIFIAHLGIKNLWPIIFGLSVIGAIMMFFLFLAEKIRSKKESTD